MYNVRCSLEAQAKPSDILIKVTSLLKIEVGIKKINPLYRNLQNICKDTEEIL